MIFWSQKKVGIRKTESILRVALRMSLSSDGNKIYDAAVYLPIGLIGLIGISLRPRGWRLSLHALPATLLPPRLQRP